MSLSDAFRKSVVKGSILCRNVFRLELECGFISLSLDNESDDEMSTFKRTLYMTRDAEDLFLLLLSIEESKKKN